MSAAFQANAFQTTAFQADVVAGPAFQNTAFQNNAFQLTPIPVPVPVVVGSSGGGGGGSARVRRKEIEEAVDRAVAIIAARNALKTTPIAVVARQVAPIVREEVPRVSMKEIQKVLAEMARDLDRLREEDDEESFLMMAA